MSDRKAHILTRMHEALVGRFGGLDWWPSEAGSETAEGQLEICVGAILTQNTNWLNVERAIGNLRRADALRVGTLHAMRPSRLARLIRPSGYFNVKAKRLKHFIGAVVMQAGGDILRFLDRPMGELREGLLAIHGVGPETADSIILYAAGKPTFVIDAYTFRIYRRHGLLTERDTYETAKAMFEGALPRDAALFNAFHAQIVAAGKSFCRRRARCDGCPLEHFPHDATMI